MNCAISFYFRYLMLHAYDQKFEVTENLKIFCELNQPKALKPREHSVQYIIGQVRKGVRCTSDLSSAVAKTVVVLTVQKLQHITNSSTPMRFMQMQA